MIKNRLSVVLSSLVLVAIVAPGATKEIVSQSVTASSAAKQAAKLLDEGLDSFEREDLTSARQSFQAVLKLDPKEVIAQTYLGIIADKLGDLDEAERHFAVAVKNAPMLASARNNYGAILMRRGRVKLAAEQFEASLKLDKNQPHALINLGQIRFEAGSPDDLRAASDLLERAYAIEADLEVARALVVISLRLQQHGKASKYYREYISRLTVSEASNATSASSRAELGKALLEADLWEEADTELTAATALEPTNPEPVLSLARVHLARKELPSAGRLLEAAVARGIDEARIYALLAEVYEQTGHLENAIPAMRLAIQRDPQSEKYRFAYGVLLTNAYAPAAAIIRLEEALKSFPSSSRLWFAVGLAQFKHGKNAEAAAAFQRALEFDPKFAAAYAYLGVTRVEVGAYDEGISFYQKALTTDPKLGVVHYLIAEALAKQVSSNPKEIETNLKRSIELDTTFVLARLSLAKLYMRATRWEEALSELEAIVELDPEMAETYYQMGRVFARLKRTDEAQRAMATFKQLSETQKKKERTDIEEVTKRLSTVLF